MWLESTSMSNVASIPCTHCLLIICNRYDITLIDFTFKDFPELTLGKNTSDIFISDKVSTLSFCLKIQTKITNWYRCKCTYYWFWISNRLPQSTWHSRFEAFWHFIFWKCGFMQYFWSRYDWGLYDLYLGLPIQNGCSTEFVLKGISAVYI